MTRTLLPSSKRSMSDFKLPDSLWAATATPAPVCNKLSGHSEADVIVVGAGFTGLSAALHLARAGKQVVVLDNGEPGFGCSGRNGGQVNPGSTKQPPSAVIENFGQHWGERFLRFGDRSCDIVFELIDQYQIDCEAVRPGYIQGGYGRKGHKSSRDWVQQWQSRGTDVELLDRETLATLIGSDDYQSGFIDRRGGNLQPLSYARGLAAAALTEGAQIHAYSQATGVEPEGSGWRVSTAQGSVSAESLILATNGYTDNLWPGLKQALVPVTSFVLATEPLPEDILETLLPQRHAVSENTRVIVYYRLDAAGRFVIGGHGNWFNVQENGDCSHVISSTLKLFSQLRDIRWQYEWSGWLAMTMDRFPKLLQLGNNAYSGFGYNGRGIGSSTLMGQQLASVILDSEEPLLEIQPLKPITGHGFRQLGISYHLLSGVVLDWIDRRS